MVDQALVRVFSSFDGELERVQVLKSGVPIWKNDGEVIYEPSIISFRWES